MKKLLIFFLLIYLLIGCKKSETNDNYLSTIDGWTKIDFKTNYTIQIPQGFIGPGMGGFEGNTFYKSSFDNKIKLSYGFCSSLFCFDFGDSLKNPIPQNIQITNNYSQLITLDQIEYFHQNKETMGIFYFSKNDPAIGRLYWKDNGKYKDALEFEFNKAKFDTIIKIIETIKRK